MFPTQTNLKCCPFYLMVGMYFNEARGYIIVLTLQPPQQVYYRCKGCDLLHLFERSRKL